jgi:hypothetical protein
LGRPKQKFSCEAIPGLVSRLFCDTTAEVGQVYKCAHPVSSLWSGRANVPDLFESPKQESAANSFSRRHPHSYIKLPDLAMAEPRPTPNAVPLAVPAVPTLPSQPPVPCYSDDHTGFTEAEQLAFRLRVVALGVVVRFIDKVPIPEDTSLLWTRCWRAKQFKEGYDCTRDPVMLLSNKQPRIWARVLADMYVGNAPSLPLACQGIQGRWEG